MPSINAARNREKSFEFVERSASYRLSDAATIDRTTKAAQIALQTNELVYACLKVKADAALDPRLIVQQRKRNKEWVEVEGHPLRQLITQPNPRSQAASTIACENAPRSN